MKTEKIKPIPKYMLELIKKADKKNIEIKYDFTRFYAYLTTNDRELTKVTVACKNRGKKWFCKQVAVHGVNSNNCFVKDFACCMIHGYLVGWYKEGLTRHPKWWETGNWEEAYDKYFNVYAPVINKEYALKFPNFKYSALDKYKKVDVFKYLRLYEQYPQAEILLKFGLSNIATSKQILRKIAKDKPFRKWLINNQKDIAKQDYYVSTLLLAYKTGKSLETAQKLETYKKQLNTATNYKPLRIIFKNNSERLFNYLEKNNTDLHSYKDYYDACIYLKLDMTQDKNLLPHDFRRWHNERIEQRKTLLYAEFAKRRLEQIARDETERSIKYSKFIAVSKKYLSLANYSKNGLIIIIAATPADLVMEGQALQHCVGGINYTNRMADGESLIFFVRHSENPDIPFVTLEYSVKQKQVLQCYAYDNTRPDNNVIDFVNNIWLPYANKQINKIKRAKRSA